MIQILKYIIILALFGSCANNNVENINSNKIPNISSSFFPGNYPANKVVISWLILGGFFLVFGIINIVYKNSFKKTPINSVIKLKKSTFDLIAHILFFVLLYFVIVIYVDFFMHSSIASGRARNGYTDPSPIWLKLIYYFILFIIPYFFTIKKAIKIWLIRNNYLIISHSEIKIHIFKKEIIYKRDEVKSITIKEFRTGDGRDYIEYFLCINDNNISLAELNLNDCDFKIQKLIEELIGLDAKHEITRNYPKKILLD